MLDKTKHIKIRLTFLGILPNILFMHINSNQMNSNAHMRVISRVHLYQGRISDCVFVGGNF